MIEATLHSLEPRALWSIFFEICGIPHPSHKESALAEALLLRARKAGLEAGIDGAGNLILRKPASPGLEKAPRLILQAHLDMVAQVEEGSALDMDRDPVRPRFDPAQPLWLCASGSTLGADDGIGVAAGLALLEDAELRHGPLELLLTVNEEDGMSGARGLEQGSLQGTLLLNLDGEDEEEICVGCSGGLRLGARFPASLGPIATDAAVLSLELGGLSGGHSAQDIDKGRGNAILLLAALLEAGAEAAPGLRLCRIEGGSAANAIPRDASALVALPPAELEAFEKAIARETERISGSLCEADLGFHFSFSPAIAPLGDSRAQPAPSAIAPGDGSGLEALGPEDSARLIGALAGAPQGLRSMSEEIPGLVTLSSNLGVLSWKPRAEALLEALILVRGARDAEKESYAREIRGHFERAGARVEQISNYPAWTPELDSPLLKRAREVYRSAYGREALIKATHGGLECGLFRAAYPAWDMLSIGPNIRFPHSPSERVEIASVERFWRFLRSLVEALGQV